MVSVEYGTLGCSASGVDVERRTVFCPDELHDIQTFFNECCRECGFEKHSQQALALGGAVMRLYRQGQYDRELLKKLLVSPLKALA